ncbi:MAG TPA: PIN domain-containing protein [Chitinispirillaceae bacterium]|nr:PIN domain-containing protein [Chitinispirillaceae bacterium]
MVIVDTSIWVDHLSKGCSELEVLLHNNEVTLHPYVIGELACGSIRNRKLILSFLTALPSVPILTHSEYFAFIDNNKLMGIGLGFVDIHILGSALLSETKVFTRDKALLQASEKLRLRYC